MSLFARYPRTRWLVPLFAVVVLATAGSVAAAVSASAHDPLPARSASQLLVDVQNARVEGLSGTVVQSAALGLPNLPGPTGQDSSSFSSLVSGSHTLRLWYAGPEQARVALLGQLGESDLVRNGSDVWLWSSHDNSASHFTVSADAAGGPALGTTQPPMTPQQAADQALKAITPTTEVRTEATQEVAGRSAYQLVLVPRDPATLIGSVKIAVDGATHIPTRVQVFARGGTSPAFEIGFTSFNPSRPASSVFAFNPPPGASVTQGLAHTSGGKGSATPDATERAKPEVIGDGWTAVAKAKMPASADRGSSSLGNLDQVVKSLPKVSGSWGSGHLLRGTLFSVLITDDGQVVAGAVAPERLYAALAAR